MNTQIAFANRKRTSTDATIHIRNLRLRTFIGFNPEEMQKQQDVVINIEINYMINESVLRDQVEDVLNYKVITKRVIEHVEQGRFLLLENLVADVLAICSDHPGINFTRVSVDKPHALRFADSVSLAFEYHAVKENHSRHLETAA